MASSSWPNSGHNAGAVTDDEYEKLVAPYTPSGLIGAPADTPTCFGDGSGRQVKFRANRYALVRGQVWSSNGSDITKSVAANASGSTRYDLAVIGLDRSTHAVTEYVKAGNPGSGPPTTQNDLGSTGKYEIPTATIKVTNGATSIAAIDVTPVAWFLAPQGVVCTSTTRPPHAPGLDIYETDTQKSYTSSGSAWLPAIIDTGWAAVTASASWTANGYGIRIRSVGGIAYLVCEVQRTGTDLPPNTDSEILRPPSTYWPSSALPAGVPFLFWTGGVVGLGRVQSDGRLVLRDYSTTIPTGQNIIVQAAAWPIG